MLLEVLAALSILAFVAAGVTGVVRQALDAVRRAEAARVEVGSQSAFLGDVSLWSSADFDRHLGTTRQGAWRLTVRLAAHHVYTVVLADSSGVKLFETAMYRPE